MPSTRRKTLLVITLAILIFPSLSFGEFFQNAEATYVTGNIEQDTIWNLPRSPYVITNNVTVRAGALLTIEPGVEVRFGVNSSLIVEGSLLATAESSERQIIFTSNRINPEPDDWNTIMFRDEVNGSNKLKNCRISYANNGVTVESGGTVVIERCEIRNNAHSGIMIIGKSNIVIPHWKDITDYIVIVGNSIFYNGDNGVALSSKGPNSYVYNTMLVNNSVHSNGGDGVNVNVEAVDGAGYVHNLTLCGNSISFNKGNGVGVRSSADRSYVYHLTISGNSVFSNRGKGIEILGSSGGGESYVFDITISNNQIFNSTQAGVRLLSNSYESVYLYDLVLSNNTISNINGDAVTAESYSFQGASYVHNVTLSSNSISSNNVDGVRINSQGFPGYMYDVVLFNNSVSSNSGKGIRLNCAEYYPTQFGAVLEKNRVSGNAEGISISAHITTKIVGNMIFNNSQGIVYVETQNNLAIYNEIYLNACGMKVSDRATVDAKYNYWGDETGPYHEGLNPSGKGNPVNGDDANLIFSPFLQYPLGYLEVYVKDTNGNPINEAMVTLTSQAEQLSLILTTNTDGYAAFDYIKLGNYTIQVDKTGYQRSVQQETVAVRQSAEATIILEREGKFDFWLFLILALVGIVVLFILVQRVLSKRVT